MNKSTLIVACQSLDNNCRREASSLDKRTFAFARIVSTCWVIRNRQTDVTCFVFWLASSVFHYLRESKTETWSLKSSHHQITSVNFDSFRFRWFTCIMSEIFIESSNQLRTFTGPILIKNRVALPRTNVRQLHRFVIFSAYYITRNK